MDNRESHDLSYKGLVLGTYTLTEYVGEGNIGVVYKAVSSDTRPDLACKLIPQTSLKIGWQRELEKVSKLAGIPNVVQYHSHDEGYDRNNQAIVWILWTFIKGDNLGQFIEKYPERLNIPFVEIFTRTVLEVLHACSAVEIVHGDLHAGNILISEPDPRVIRSPNRIWVSDFGYGGSHNATQPKDDYRQLNALILSLLERIDFSALPPRDRLVFIKLTHFAKRDVLELDHTQYIASSITSGNIQGSASRAELLLQRLEELVVEAVRESSVGSSEASGRTPSDYLYAEAIGHSVEEWRNLFVPEFLAVRDLLSRNITVLTGARGCGKTMAFRRLTAYMDFLLRQPSGVPGAETFIGYYMNCRDLVEVFPWIPSKLNVGAEQQLIHFFHLAWLIEICRTLTVADEARKANYSWLEDFMLGQFPDRFLPSVQGVDILAQVLAFLDNEKERCRLTPFSNRFDTSSWPFSRLDFLDVITTLVNKNVAWVMKRPTYFFLDDYTIPIVPRQLQIILNKVIYRRRSEIFFKVSSEATNSFALEMANGKPLELHQDFQLVDLATESLHQDKARQPLLERIFAPRIDRHPLFVGKNYGLSGIL